MLALLSLFTNVTLGTSTCIEGLAEAINDRFLTAPQNFSSEVINRALLTVSRLRYENTQLFGKFLRNF